LTIVGSSLVDWFIGWYNYYFWIVLTQFRAKNDWKDKCIELEQLYNEMLLHKQMNQAEDANQAKKTEELERLREECDELKMTVSSRHY
jgi:hypothetical protein